MTKRYSVSEARAKLPTILREAEAGQEVELTRHGKTVAVLVSSQEMERLHGQRPSFSERLEKFRAKHPDFYLDPDFAASVRDRSLGRDVEL